MGEPKVFITANGEPLPIFVESNGVFDNRPKLIRTLRNYGADICIDVSRARIILVEPHSSEGRQFVRDWGADPGKVILEIAWVRRCLEAGRALLENDMWGGCGNLDGTPLDEDTPDDDEGLFTNRKASVLNGKGVVSPQKARMQIPSSAKISNGHPPSVLPTPQPTPPTSRATAIEALSSANYNGALPSQQTFASSSMSTPASVPPVPNFPPNLPPSMTPPFGQLVPHAQFAANPINPQMMQYSPEVAEMFMRMMSMMQGMVPGGQIMSPGWQGPPPQAFIQTPQGFQIVQSIPSPQPSLVMPPDANGQHTNAPLSYAEPPPSARPGHYNPPPMASEPQLSTPRRSISPLPTIETFRESDSESPVPDRSTLSQRGEKRARDSNGSSPTRTAKHSRTTPSQKGKKKRDRRNRESLSMVRSIEQRAPVARESPQTTGIFTGKDGDPMTFFLQVQLRNRKDFLPRVRKNGGRLVTELSKADFIILDGAPGKERDQWLKVARDLKRLALRSAFIEACINANGIVEEEDFAIEPPPRKGGKSGRSKKKSQGNLETEKGSSQSPSQGSQGQNSMIHDDVSGRRSPTPPVTQPVARQGGRSAFTFEEIAYARRFGEYMVRKDPTTPLNQIAVKLGRRAPSHPSGSWHYILNKHHRAELDQLRGTGFDAGHDAGLTAAGSTSEPEEMQVEEQLAPINEVKEQSNVNGYVAAAPGNETTNQQSNLHDLDLRNIIHFFANPPEGMVEDDALWAAIASTYTCRTAPTWQDYYEANQEIVNERLREALNLRSWTNGTPA